MAQNCMDGRILQVVLLIPLALLPGVRLIADTGDSIPCLLPPQLMQQTSFARYTPQDLQAVIQELTNQKFSQTSSVIHIAEEPPHPPISVEDRTRTTTFLASLETWRDHVYTQLYPEGQDFPTVWVYPASGWDLATLVMMVPPFQWKIKSHVFFLISGNAPFVQDNAVGDLPTQMTYREENFYETTGRTSEWSEGLAHRGVVQSRSESSGGILALLLGRLRSFLGPRMQVHHVVAFRDHGYIQPWKYQLHTSPQPEHETHGLVVFQIDGGPLQFAFYFQGWLHEGGGSSPYPFDMLLTNAASENPRVIPLASMPLVAQTQAVFVRGSTGALSPKPQSRGTPNLSRLFFLETLAKNQGLLLEGVHQNPDIKPEYHRFCEPDPAWEVTPELHASSVYFLRKPTSAENTTLSLEGRTHPVTYVQTNLKWSYYDGARALRFSK